jgi:hypothetical protein
MKDPDVNHEEQESVPECRPRSNLALGLIALFLALVGCGLAIGDVFETYENGSNL